MKTNNRINNAYRLYLAVFFTLIISCVHNYEPIISSLVATPNPINPGGTVYLECVASDDDQSNMLKSDNLIYDWNAAYGNFTVVQETTIVNVREDTIYTEGDTTIFVFGDTTIADSDSDSIRLWTAPQDSGHYSISCTVSDLFGGSDVNTINIKVE